jgi:Tol biopolymer transport system component
MQGFRVQNSWGTGSGSWPTGLGWISYSAVTNGGSVPSYGLKGYYLTFDKPILGRIQRLTYNSADELSASISDERNWGEGIGKIAFITEAYGTPNPGVTGELCVINRDGTGLKRLTYGGLASQPSMSRSSSSSTDSARAAKIAFIWGTGTSAELYTIYADGTNLRRVTYNSVPESEPSISYARWIAFISGSGTSAELYIYYYGTGSMTRLTYNSVPESQPSVSGWGGGIVFISGSGTSAELYYITNDGTGLRRLTYNSVAESWPTISYYDKKPACPSGYNSRITFMSGSGTSSELYAINADGTTLRRLTYNSLVEVYPRISKDGNTVAFVCGIEAYDMITWGGGFLKRLTYTSGPQKYYTDTSYWGDLVICLTYSYTTTTRELAVFYGPATP